MKRFIFIVLAIVLAGAGLLGCTNEFSDHDADTGGLWFQVIWPDDVIQRKDAAGAEAEMLAASVDCNASGISTVRCEVYAGTETSANYLTGETFSCTAHGGRIGNVSAGSNRRLVVYGRDSSGKDIFRSHLTGITITAGKFADAGMMRMQRINMKPTAIITTPSNNSTYTFGDEVNFTGAGTDPEDSEVKGSTFIWLSSIEDQINIGQKSFSTSSLSTGIHTITLIVTDSGGKSASKSVSITIKEPVQFLAASTKSQHDGVTESRLMATDPPDPPTNVQASQGTYSDRVRITWAASTGATSYEVYRSTSISAAKSRIGTPGTTLFTDTTLTCGVNYYYWVKAVNASGSSVFSDWSVGYCQGTQPPPPPPVQGVSPVSPAQAKQMLDENVGLIVVDASDPVDYERDHILCALNATWESTFESLDYKNIGIEPYKASDILVYDQKNTFGQTAAEYLASQGFTAVHYLTGGLETWIAAGYETVPCSYECGNCGLPPMAHAGPDQTVNENAIFTLDGSMSGNPGAGSLTYSWSQYKGTRANIANPNSAKPTVTAPSVQEGGETLIFHLTVTDSQGDKDMDSVQVKVNWAFENSPPTARAGADQGVVSGAEVVLDGTRSSDPDDGIEQYRWNQTGGSLNVTLTGATTSVASFTAPSVESEPVILIFELTVTDKGGLSDTDEVIITISVGNQPPAAVAGDPQSVSETARVTLDGSGSYDPDGDALFFEWRQIGSPAVDLINSATARPEFTAPRVSGSPVLLTFQLTVRDNKGGEHSDRVDITVEDVGEPPFADAGLRKMVIMGDIVTMDSYGSYDKDGEISGWQWIQISGPSVTLVGADTSTASFMAPIVEEGRIILIFLLTVTDDTGLTDMDLAIFDVN